MRRRVIHFKARAGCFAGQSFLRRMRWRIGGDNADGVATVGKHVRVEIHEAVVHTFAQQLPASFTVTAIVNVVASVSLLSSWAFHFTTMECLSRDRRSRRLVAPGAELSGRVSSRRHAPADHDGHVIHFGSDILRQVIDSDAIDDGRVTGVQYRLPLNEARRRGIDGEVLLEIDLLPRLQLRSGLSTLPLRAKSSKLPLPRTSTRPHLEKFFASKTSLS